MHPYTIWNHWLKFRWLVLLLVIVFCQGLWGAYQALKSNTIGNSNVAFGRQALTANTTGSNNVAVGDLALLSNTTGQYSVAIGECTLYNSTYFGENL